MRPPEPAPDAASPQFAAVDVIDDVIDGVEHAVRADWHST
jgi:hypothetical protein